jgi:lysozyme
MDKKLIIDMAVEFLKEVEGFRSEVYDDLAGLPTIGYGHALKLGEKFKTITREEAENLLRKDIIHLLYQVEPLVERELNENQWAAILGFVYNIGLFRFSFSTFLMKLNTGKPLEEVAQELDRWIYVNGKPVEGLINRRKAEKELFLSGLDKDNKK